MQADARHVGGSPLHADRALAALLEGHSAFELKEFVATARGLDPASQAECVAIAGGTMAFVEPDSLVNQAIALGLVGPVTEDDVRAVEGFYRARRARASVCVCPLAHPSLIASLAARGWVPEAFEHVLVRRLTGGAHGPDRGDIVVHEVVTDEERDAWALAAATGFSDPLPPQPQQLDLGRIVVRRPGARLFLAFVDGRVAGTGELHMRDGVAWLSGDATLTHFRRRGVQSALQRHRLDLAAQAGCELAVTESTPGSGSQRNMERLGFRIAYTRVDVIPGPGAALRPAASHEPEAS